MFSTQQNLEVKDRILHVARDLFIKNGFKGTSVRDIATKAETNVAMVNYYFRSKYKLFEVIFEETLDTLWQKIFTSLTSDREFFELVEVWITSYYETLMENPHIPSFLLTEVSLDPGKLTDRFKERDPYNLYLKISERIREEVKKGTIRATPPLDFLLNVLSLCIFPFILDNLARPLADVSGEEYHSMLIKHKTYVVDFVVQALKP